MPLEKYTYNIRYKIDTIIEVTYKTDSDSNSLDLFYRELEKRAEELKKQREEAKKSVAETILQKVKNTTGWMPVF